MLTEEGKKALDKFMDRMSWAQQGVMFAHAMSLYEALRAEYGYDEEGKDAGIEMNFHPMGE